MLRPVPKPVKKQKAKKKRKQKSKRTRLIEELDRYDSYHCLVKNNFTCLMCGKPANQNHHFFPKGSHGNVRFNRDNHCPMCYSCHMIRVHMAGEVEELRDCLIKKIGSDNFERLKESAYKVSDFSEEFLESLLKVKMLQFTELCNVYQDRTLQLPNAGLVKLEKARKLL